MSDVSGTQNQEDEGIDLNQLDGNAAFAALMDVLVAEEAGTEGGEGGAATDAAAAGGGAPGAADEGAAAEGGAAAAPAGGADGAGAVAEESAAAAAARDAAAGDAAAAATGTDAAAAAAAAAGAAVADGAAEAPDAAEYDANWGEALTSLEARTQEEFQQASIAEARAELGKYFEAVEMHPRQLVGQEVPKGDGSTDMIRIADEQDATSWQTMIRQHLVAEVKDRTSRKVDEARPMLNTLTSSIELFRKNPELIPSARQFNLAIASEFLQLAKPYELRIEGKHVGYSIPIEGLLEQVKARHAAAATAATAAQPTAQQQRAAEQARNGVGQFTNADLPQEGIATRAGAGGEDKDDYSILFGTLGGDWKNFRV